MHSELADRAPDGTVTALAGNPSSPLPDDGYFQIINVTTQNPPYYTMYVRAPLSLADPSRLDILVTRVSLSFPTSDPMVVTLMHRPQHTVTVQVQGDGHVTSNPPGITCGTSPSGRSLTDCTHVFPTGLVTLAPQGNSPTRFTEWGGNCVPNQQVCNVALTGPGDTSVVAIAKFGQGQTSPRQTGVDEITFFRSTDPGDDQFVYKNPLLLFMPEDARFTSVTNVSQDANLNGVKLNLVRHTDANGVSGSLGPSNCQPAVLEPQASTSSFNGLLVQGEWKVRAGCSSQFLLNPPARIALRIAWTQ